MTVSWRNGEIEATRTNLSLNVSILQMCFFSVETCVGQSRSLSNKFSYE